MFSFLLRSAVVGVLEIAAGDKLLITANRHEPRFRATNGEIVTVERVDQKGQVQLRDGRVLPPSFKQFAHGYAVTAHRSQGKSVDCVIISGDGMRRELFYVAATRGMERVVVATSDQRHGPILQIKADRRLMRSGSE